jgi:hypothetical protein
MLLQQRGFAELFHVEQTSYQRDTGIPGCAKWRLEVLANALLTRFRHYFAA